MNILFIHQNMPGQYKHLAPAFSADPKNRVAFITKEGKPDIRGVTKATYRTTRGVTQNIHQYLVRLEDQILHGQGAARAALNLKQNGFVPDVICGHTGWGETLFMRDVFPDTPMLAFCEFYYSSRNSDIDFSPNKTENLDRDCRTRIRNAHMILSLESADWGISPTWWQRSRHPKEFRSKISVIHDGVDTVVCRPRKDARVLLANGRTLSAADEVVTYVARNLEPYRGFDIFMQAIDGILTRRPKAEILIIGGDEVSYGDKAPDFNNWRESMLSMVNFDAKRVHFMSRVPYGQFQDILSISSAHVYLTYPFVLSWSMLEAMAHECLMIVSDTPPVAEVVKDGENGLLVDFFNPPQISDRVVDALENQERYAEMRRQARRTVIERYDLATVCLPAQLDLIRGLAEGRMPPPVPD